MRHYKNRPTSDFHFQEIVYEKKGRLATITINRQRYHNSYSTLVLEELATAFHDVADDDSIQVAVLTGAGDRAFCTGGFVHEYAEDYVGRPRDYWKYMGRFRAFFDSILHNGKPTIARLNGIAVGGGNETQLACDLTVMAEHAYIKHVGTSVGSVACGGATQWLPLVVGDKRAREILYLNRPIAARKALEWGLVNEVVPSVKKEGQFVENATQEQIDKALTGKDGYGIDLTLLDRAVAELVEALLESFPECTRYTKEQTNFFKDMVWSATIGHASEWLALHYSGLEAFEGMNAFVEKREPDYRMVRDRLANDDSPETPWGAGVRQCTACGAKGLPAKFVHCGNCGAALKPPPALAGPG